MPVEKNLQKILMMLEEKKSLWRRLVEWAFPNFKINKNILLIHPDMSGIKTSQNRKRFCNRMISINLLKLPSSQGIVGEKSFVASR
mgnify:CR=1 FL=1